MKVQFVLVSLQALDSVRPGVLVRGKQRGLEVSQDKGGLLNPFLYIRACECEISRDYCTHSPLAALGQEDSPKN